MEFKEEIFNKEFSSSVLDQQFDLYHYEDTELAKFDINDVNGNVIHGNESYEYTPSFINSFCNILTIPYNFGRKIPIDLFKFNVNRLKNETKINTNVKFVYRDNTLVNIMKTGSNPFFKCIKPSEILTHFGSDKFEIKECAIGDSGFHVDLIHKDLSNFEVTKPGDIVNIGYRFINPFTMFGVNFSAGLYLNQLVCSNGMVANRLLGKRPMISLKNNLGGDEIYMETMEKELRLSVAGGFSLEKTGEIIKGMLNTSINYRHLMPIMNKAATYQPNYINDVFKIDWTKEKVTYEKLHKDNEKDDSAFKYFDIMFNMTQLAQKLDLRAKLQIEDYADTIIGLYQHQISLN